MLLHDDSYRANGVWDRDRPAPSFHLVLSEEAAAGGMKHVSLYTHKGLMKKVVGLKALAEEIGAPEGTLRKTYEDYRDAAKSGEDEFGKNVFKGLPGDIGGGNYYVGRVVPVLHYCMGGLKIDKSGNVLGEDGLPLRGLRAAGEVSGGVHGNNRLGGNSLLECTVFGSLIGESVEIEGETTEIRERGGGATDRPFDSSSSPGAESARISMADVSLHSKKGDCWIALHEKVYNLGEFADEHPPGPDSIWELCGQNATDVFKAVHSENMLEDFDEEFLGHLHDHGLTAKEVTAL